MSTVIQALPAQRRTNSLFGDDLRCLVIAEVGINHNGSLELAKAHIDAAAAAGADAVKFQTYKTEDFISDESLKYEYIDGGRKISESQWNMFKRCELSRIEIEKIAEHCRTTGVLFAATPTSMDGVAELVSVGAAFLKNGSDFLQHLPLISEMARSGLPTVLSAGMANIEEIDDAVGNFRASGGAELAVLHCVSVYPTPAERMNLRRMLGIRQKFSCTVGLSDHSEGISAAVASVAMGGRIVEKHFTVDRNLPGPDHRFSANQAELTELVAAIRLTETMLGSGELAAGPTEEQARLNYRLSCVAARDLPAGLVLDASHIAFRRPGSGIPPKELPTLLGQRLTRRRLQGELLRTEDLA